MAASVDPSQLPDGFTLEADPAALPDGFTLETAPQAPPSGLVHDFYTGAANLASKVPYLPEAANAVEAGLGRVGANLPFADRATAGLAALTGTGDYDSNLAMIRADNAKRWKEHPYQEMGATLAGSLIPAIGSAGKVAQAPSLINGIVRGATTGLGWGTTQGVSDVPDYTNVSGTDVGNVAKSGAAGLGVGAVLPIAGKVLGAGYRALTNSPYRNVAGMELPAQTEFTKALLYDDPARVKTDLTGQGPQGMPVDVSPSLKTKMMGIAAGPASPAKTELMRELETRNLGAYDTASKALDANFGQAQSPGQFLGGLDAKAQAIAQEPMNTAIAARNSGVNVDTTNLLANLGTSLSNAQGNTKVTAALNKVRNGLLDPVLDPQGKPIPGLFQPVTDPLVLHNVKKDFDTLIDHGDPTLGIEAKDINQRGGPVITFRGQLNSELRNAIPGYGDANDKLSSLIRQREQFELGQNSLSNSSKNVTDPRDFATVFNALPPEEQAARKAGERSNMGAILGAKGDNPNIRNPMGPLINAFNGEHGWNQQNLGTSWGQQPVTNMMNTLNAGRTQAGTYNDLYKGSMTSMRESAKADNGVVPWRAPEVSRGLIAGPINTALRLGTGALNAFRSGLPPDMTARDLQMVRGATQQGPGAQAVIDALLGANSARGRNAADADALVKALMTGAVSGASGTWHGNRAANQ